MNADGSNVVKVTGGRGGEWPIWSPDGSRVAYVSGTSLYSVEKDGGNRILTRFAFFAGRDGQADVFVMNADGSNVVKVTGGRGGEWPIWSPDGSRVAYVSGTVLRRKGWGEPHSDCGRWRANSYAHLDTCYGQDCLRRRFRQYGHLCGQFRWERLVQPIGPPC